VNEVRRIIEEPVTTEELQDAKDYLTGSFVFAFESSPQIARFLVHAEVYGLGFDYIEKYPEYIRAITVEDITRVAKTYLDSENYTLVVVGPTENEMSGANASASSAQRSNDERSVRSARPKGRSRN
jgi:zinc protease